MRRRQEQERRQRLAADEAAAARRQQQEWLVVAVDEAVRAQRVLAWELDCAQPAQSAERRVGRGLFAAVLLPSLLRLRRLWEFAEAASNQKPRAADVVVAHTPRPTAPLDGAHTARDALVAQCRAGRRAAPAFTAITMTARQRCTDLETRCVRQFQIEGSARAASTTNRTMRNTVARCDNARHHLRM